MAANVNQYESQSIILSIFVLQNTINRTGQLSHFETDYRQQKTEETHALSHEHNNTTKGAKSDAMMSKICAAYSKNRRGPKTDTCGMPNKSIISIERIPLNKTRWSLSVRNDRFQVWAIPPKSKLDCSLDSKMS